MMHCIRFILKLKFHVCNIKLELCVLSDKVIRFCGCTINNLLGFDFSFIPFSFSTLFLSGSESHSNHLKVVYEPETNKTLQKIFSNHD